jgi:hypothetical protein
MWEKVTLIQFWGECKLVQPLWKTVWRPLKKTKNRTTYDAAILLLRIYLKNFMSDYNKCICTHMFIVALFTIPKLWIEPR